MHKLEKKVERLKDENKKIKEKYKKLKESIKKYEFCKNLVFSCADSKLEPLRIIHGLKFAEKMDSSKTSGRNFWQFRSQRYLSKMRNKFIWKRY